MTREDLLKMGFTESAMQTLIYNLGRNRHLAITCLGTPNEMAFLEEVDDGINPTKVEDLVCVHNYDYDGYLIIEKVEALIAAISYNCKVAQKE